MYSPPPQPPEPRPPPLLLLDSGSKAWVSSRESCDICLKTACCWLSGLWWCVFSRQNRCLPPIRTRKNKRSHFQQLPALHPSLCIVEIRTSYGMIPGKYEKSLRRAACFFFCLRSFVCQNKIRGLVRNSVREGLLRSESTTFRS